MDEREEPASPKSSDEPQFPSASLYPSQEGDNNSTQKKSELVDRIQALRSLTGALKQKLKEEKDLWRKEIDELCRLQRENDISNVLWDAELSTADEDSGDQEEKQHCQDIAVIEYDKKISKCQEMLGALHRDKIQKEQRRQYAVRHYKKKLMEVERMCSMELARMKQTATSYLEPLNKMASEWPISHNEFNRNAASLSMNDLPSSAMGNGLEGNLTDITADLHLAQGPHSSVMSAGVQLMQSADSKREHVTVKMAMGHEMNTSFWHEQGDGNKSQNSAFSTYASRD